ncbi:hypothetical protein XELAEV_18003832mg [Xenopus laevis]|uniref:Sulfotransferase n=1 Tax=Xenopus laevis TaxID=8355 RepID=A0A974BN16_XENLA|nr:hypothetical protein XELAEV_18003832mg [Xenopus laevis]
MLIVLLQILVVFRNPKDTALSYYHFYKNNPVFPTYSSWDTFFEDFMTGNGTVLIKAFLECKYIQLNNILKFDFKFILFK